MGHFNDMYLDNCDRRTSDDDILDRRDGVSSTPKLFTTTDLYRKEIQYDRETRDYAMYLDDELVGFARTYHEAEVTLDQLVFELLSAGHFHAATDLDGGVDGYDSAAEQALAEFDNRNPAMVDASVAATPHPRYTRRPTFDNERHGHAWVDRLGLTRWLPAGVDPNL